jgi:hypothetical protein
LYFGLNDAFKNNGKNVSISFKAEYRKKVQGSDTTMLEKELSPEQKKLFLEAAIFLFLMQVLL